MEHKMEQKRWYDEDKKLSIVVKAMECMDISTQLKFADKLLELSRELVLEKGGEQLLASLDEEKRRALEKARNRRRWYDQIEELHLAFNNMYAMTALGRREMATKFATPIMLVGAYEKHCRKEGCEPVMRIIQEILWTSLLENGVEVFEFRPDAEAPRRGREPELPLHGGVHGLDLGAHGFR